MTTHDGVLLLPRLRRDQYDIAAHTAKVKVLCAGRRWGKTVLGGVMTLLVAQGGGRAAWIVPEYRNGRPLWRWAERVCMPLQKHGVRINRTERMIDFPNGGGVAIYSADNIASVLGENFHFVALDEAARIPADAWYDAIMPTLADNAGDALLISTPKGRNWFFDEYMRQDGRQQSWRAPSTDNPSVNIRQAAELARDRVPERTYRQEWLAEFVEDSGGVFRRVTDAATASPLSHPEDGHTYVIGVDFGKLNDFTVAIVMDVQTRAVVAIDRYNRIDYTIQAERLKILHQQWQAQSIVAEVNVAEMLLEVLSRDGLPIVPFRTTAQTKAPLIDALTLAFERGEISILRTDSHPDARVLADELMAYEMERLPAGGLRYNAPSGRHDDTVIALALAWHGVTEASQPLMLFSL